MFANLRGIVDAGIMDELDGIESMGCSDGTDGAPTPKTSLNRPFAGVAFTCTAGTRPGFFSSVVIHGQHQTQLARGLHLLLS